MHYDFIAIPEREVPRAADPLFQHRSTSTPAKPKGHLGLAQL